MNLAFDFLSSRLPIHGLAAYSIRSAGARVASDCFSKSLYINSTANVNAMDASQANTALGFMRCVHDPVNALGSTYRSRGYLPQDKDHSMEGTVVSSDAPKRFAVRSKDKDGEFVNTLELTPQGGQTTVTRTVEFPVPKGAFVVLVPVLLPTVIRPAIQKGMNMLKAKVEGSA